MYIIAPVKPEMSIHPNEVVHWRTSKEELKGNVRAGLMSQISPESKYIVTTINDLALIRTHDSSLSRGTETIPSNYYVANFKD